MKDSILEKLRGLQERYQEISELLADSEIIQDQKKFISLSKEYSELEPIVEEFNKYQTALEDLSAAEEMLEDDDMKEFAQNEIQLVQTVLQELEDSLQVLILPADPKDECNVFLEIRGGAGGDEAAIFAGDLFRMYSKFAENNNWKLEIVSEALGEHGGYKSVVTRITGKGVYSKLKFESGAHRVQRVPATESQGRVHTSTCTVAILPEANTIEEIDINPADLKIDTYRSSGAGGQHVNTTDSAVRITHLPTNTVVECQDERSQHKNKAKAMSLLQAKILAKEQEKQQSAEAEQRRNLVGTGDRSEKIRTYNFPQGRVTDHRINLTLYKLPDVIEGNMQELVNALNKEHQLDQLAELESS